jgi:hypothetical protein
MFPMKRLRRIMSNGMLAVLALLWVAVVAVWVRSHWRRDSASLRFAPHSSDYNYQVPVESNLGVLTLSFERAKKSAQELQTLFLEGRGTEAEKIAPPLPPLWAIDHHSYDAYEYSSDGAFWQQLGFYYDEMPAGGVFGPGRVGAAYIGFPHWAPAVLIGCPLLGALLRVRKRRRRARAGLCGRCGYDLCASPDRCPECGNEVRLPG